MATREVVQMSESKLRDTCTEKIKIPFKLGWIVKSNADFIGKYSQIKVSVNKADIDKWLWKGDFYGK